MQKNRQIYFQLGYFFCKKNIQNLLSIKDITLNFKNAE